MFLDDAQSAGPPSGQQYAIAHGNSHAQVTQIGATLRSCTVDGVDVVDGFGTDERATDGRGQVLAPWPNRLTDGSYRYGGRDCQAPINELGRNTAIHGLVRWLDWSPVAHESASVTLSCAVRPQPGYEWQLDLQVTYALDDSRADRDLPGGQRRHRASSVRRRVPSLPHSRNDLDRRARADPARHRLP